MNTNPFSLTWDVESIFTMQRLLNGGTAVANSFQMSLEGVGAIIRDMARLNMHWINPTGALEASLRVFAESPYSLEVGSDLLYAARREYGFSGQTDSLGRTYTNDPGQFYLTKSLLDYENAFLQLFQAHIQRSIGGI